MFSPFPSFPPSLEGDESEECLEVDVEPAVASIEADNAPVFSHYQPLNLSNLHSESPKFQVVYADQTVRLVMRDWNGPIVDGGDLYGEYILREVRLRLGDKLRGATKHLIDGQGYPAEIDLIHWKVPREPRDARQDSPPSHEAAVLTVFLQESPKESSALDYLLDSLDKSASTVKMTVGKLLPRDTSSFLRYEDNSRDEDHCNRHVAWTVFPELLHISSKQFQKLKKLAKKLNPGSKKTLNNKVEIRHVTDVYFMTPPEDEDSESPPVELLPPTVNRPNHGLQPPGRHHTYVAAAGAEDYRTYHEQFSGGNTKDKEDDFQRSEPPRREDAVVSPTAQADRLEASSSSFNGPCYKFSVTCVALVLWQDSADQAPRRNKRQHRKTGSADTPPALLLSRINVQVSCGVEENPHLEQLESTLDAGRVVCSSDTTLHLPEETSVEDDLLKSYLSLLKMGHLVFKSGLLYRVTSEELEILNMWRGGKRSSIGISHEESRLRPKKMFRPSGSSIPVNPEAYLTPISFLAVGHSFIERAMAVAVAQPDRFPRLQASAGTRFVGLPRATAKSLLDHLQRDIFAGSRPRVPPHVTVHCGENELDHRDLTEEPGFYVEWQLELLSFLFLAGAQKIVVIKPYPRGESPTLIGEGGQLPTLSHAVAHILLSLCPDANYGSEIKTSVQQSLGESPYEVLFGIEPRTPIEFDALPSFRQPFAGELASTLHEMRQRVLGNLRNAQEKQKKALDNLLRNMWRGGKRFSIGISHEESRLRPKNMFRPSGSSIPVNPEAYLTPISFLAVGHSFIERAMAIAVAQPDRFPRLQASAGTRFVGLPGAMAKSLLDHLQRDIFAGSPPRVPPHVTVHCGENELDNRDLTEEPGFYVEWQLELLSFLFLAGAQKIVVIKPYPRGMSEDIVLLILTGGHLWKGGDGDPDPASLR
ncbi:unnamed protein product [Darwinula stevensoni]|uniref:carbonic anhydrase n=1 Tax=Darwinula stevensoni TaxID=69355 RepID=A0A7R9ACH5_9CRUS|nr:unnamed protein product [Darwinula stevensoni]CAG0900304.1 unnamed protein product [Darwinula stevensoni]